jgi:hypothetical protein
MKWGDIGHWLFGGSTTKKGRNFLFGSDNELEKVPTGTPEQGQLNQDLIGLINQMMQQGGGYQGANDYYNKILQPGQEGFNNFSQPYRQQFNEKVVPQIGERFAGAGALSSSGFGQALGGAASDFESQLAQMFAQLQGQAAQAQYGQFNQMSNQALNYQPFAYHDKQGSSGLIQQLLAAYAGSGGGIPGAGAWGNKGPIIGNV